MKGNVENVSLAVQIGGKRFYVALPADRMVMLLKLAESLGDNGSLPVTANGSEFDLGPDAARLDWLVGAGAVVVSGGRMNLYSTAKAQRGYWLTWPHEDDRHQRGVYGSQREAIDAAMEGRDA